MGVEILNQLSLANSVIDCLPPIDCFSPRITAGNSVIPFPDNQLRIPDNRTRRCLFEEPINHEEVMACVKENLLKMEKDMSRRWNFDFANEKPLNNANGDYIWLPVEKAVCKNQKCPGSRKVSSARLVDETVTKLLPPSSMVYRSLRLRKKNCVKSSTDYKQIAITDFMKCTKRNRSKIDESDLKGQGKYVLLPSDDVKGKKQPQNELNIKKRKLMRKSSRLLRK